MNLSLSPSELHAMADAAGRAAANACVPAPMVVREADVFGGPLPGGKSWYVSEGLCGFAWVSIRPGNSKFANWLKKAGIARADSYRGGVCYWIADFGQSVARKEAYAHAYAKVLRDAGINAYSDSRLD